MRRIADFNFAVTRTGLPAFTLVLLLVGVLAGIMVAMQYDAATEEHERLVRQAGRLERKLEPPAIRQPPATEKSALAERRETAPFPWNAALQTIETAINPQVALLSLDTDVTAARTRLIAETRSIDDALAFAARLRDTPAVRRVLLLAHETKKAPVGAVIGFTLQIDWNLR